MTDHPARDDPSARLRATPTPSPHTTPTPSPHATPSPRTARPSGAGPPSHPRRDHVPTLYKARGVPTKQAVCAICVDRTRGRTTRLDLGYGVRVWLCQAHADAAFQTRRSGRDFILTLHRLWDAHGCLTQSRRRALDAHDARLRGARPDRGRPGSYAWPALRAQAERRFAAGAPLPAIITHLAAMLDGAAAEAPSGRTVRRWCAERRWLEQPGAPP